MENKTLTGDQQQSQPGSSSEECANTELFVPQKQVKCSKKRLEFRAKNS